MHNPLGRKDFATSWERIDFAAATAPARSVRVRQRGVGREPTQAQASTPLLLSVHRYCWVATPVSSKYTGAGVKQELDGGVRSPTKSSSPTESAVRCGTVCLCKDSTAKLLPRIYDVMAMRGLSETTGETLGSCEVRPRSRIAGTSLGCWDQTVGKHTQDSKTGGNVGCFLPIGG